MSDRIYLKGDGTWPFLKVRIDGNDLLVSDTHASWFGGYNDPLDNGETASGVSTKLHPSIIGCALPMNLASCHGSPIPKLPWLTKVRVWSPRTNKQIVTELIDLGPAKWACKKNGNCIDLSVAAFQALGHRLSEGSFQVSYRIIGGAHFINKNWS